MRNLTALLGAGTITALALAGGATAADIRVNYGDLDLNQPSQVQELRHRIDVAAQAYCRSELPRTGSRLRGGCVEDATTAVIESLPLELQKALRNGSK